MFCKVCVCERTRESPIKSKNKILLVYHKPSNSFLNRRKTTNERMQSPIVHGINVGSPANQHATHGNSQLEFLSTFFALRNNHKHFTGNKHLNKQQNIK